MWRRVRTFARSRRRGISAAASARRAARSARARRPGCPGRSRFCGAERWARAKL
jgi:hypothetical protein